MVGVAILLLYSLSYGIAVGNDHIGWDTFIVYIVVVNPAAEVR
jgi:hypothetical protein